MRAGSIALVRDQDRDRDVEHFRQRHGKSDFALVKPETRLSEYDATRGPMLWRKRAVNRIKFRHDETRGAPSATLWHAVY